MARFVMFICGLLCLLSASSVFADALKVRNDGTVLDQQTGLIWQQSSSARMPWLDAVRYCNQLDLANSRGWRLPFKEELKTLLTSVGSGDHLNTKIFSAMEAEVYWSLTREEQQPDQVWGVSFVDGKEAMYDRAEFNFKARCLIETTEAVYLPLLNKWQDAWSAQDVDAYLLCYGQEFKPDNGLSREKWVEQRQIRLKKPKSIKVIVSDIKVVSEEGIRAEIMFKQSYQSDNYSDQVMKVLTLGLERGELVIVGERTISKIK